MFFLISWSLVANPFKVIKADGDTVSLFGYAEVSKVTTTKEKIYVTCVNTFSVSSKKRNVNEWYYREDKHFMSYLEVGDFVDFHLENREDFEFNVVRLRFKGSENTMFWYDVPQKGEAKVLRVNEDFLILDNGTIMIEIKNTHKVGDTVKYKKTLKPFLVKERAK